MSTEEVPLLRVRVCPDVEFGNEVVIEGNASGLRSLAAHLLALAEPDRVTGSHLHLDEHTELDHPSASLVLDREDSLPALG